MPEEPDKECGTSSQLDAERRTVFPVRSAVQRRWHPVFATQESNAEIMSTRRLFSTLVTLSYAASSLVAQQVLVVPRDHATVQAAIAAAQSGDRIQVMPGTYVENLDLLGKLLIVESTGGPDVTVLDGSSRSDSVVIANKGEPVGTTVRGFRITGGAGHPAPSSYGFDYYGGGVLVGGPGSFLRVEDCRIEDNALSTGTFGGGVCASGNSCRAELYGCTIINNRAWASGGATLTDGTGTSMRIERCTVVGNQATAWRFGHQGGISMANWSSVEVIDSIVWGNQGYQIRAFGAPYDRGTSATVSYSCVQGGFTGTGNISSDPLFENAGARDYRLQSGSPCIDTGDPSSPVDPDGSRADMGAFPFLSGPAATFQNLGGGCAGTTQPALTSSGVPSQGSSFSVTVSGLPSNQLAVLLLGYQSLGPIDLTNIGMTGCLWQTHPDLSYSSSTGPAGQVQQAWLISSDPSAAGLLFRVQLAVRDPGGNPFGIVLSDTGEGRVGR